MTESLADEILHFTGLLRANNGFVDVSVQKMTRWAAKIITMQNEISELEEELHKVKQYAVRLEKQNVRLITEKATGEKMPESLADRLDEQRVRLCSYEEAELWDSLLNEVRVLGALVKMRPLKDVDQEEEIAALKAELDQCLTAHAELNDKVCNLEDQIEDCTDVNTELRKKIERLSK